jgi:hypothetical protein
MKPEIIFGKRRYNIWPGVGWRGLPEDSTRCIEEVWRAGMPQQCSRKRSNGPDGLYCKQHAKKHNMEAND